MFVTKALARLTIFAGLMALPNAIPTAVYAQQAVTVGATDIGGTVVGASGPEAGVWVIAETTELPTKLARIVVTDDQGRYLIPDLPTANYSIWVRPSDAPAGHIGGLICEDLHEVDLGIDIGNRRHGALVARLQRNSSTAP